MKNQKLIIPILMLGVFGIINTEMGIIGILPDIATIYHVSLSTASLLVSAFALTVALAGPTIPLLLSHVNRKTVLFVSMFCFFLSNVVSAYASNFFILILARIIPAIFQPAFTAIAFTLASESVAPDESTKAVAKVFMGVSAGMVLGVPIANIITHHASITVAMLFFGSINFIVLLGVTFFIPSLPVIKPVTYGKQLSVLKHFDMLVAIAIVIMLNGATFGFFSYMSDFLVQITHISVNVVSIYLLVYGLMNIVGSFLAGRLLTKNIKYSTFVIPIGQVIIMTLLFTLGNSWWVTGVLLILLGILAGFAGNVFQYLIFKSGREAPDFANGIFLTATNLGTTIAPFVCGMFINALSVRFALVGAVIFAIGGLICITLKSFRKQKV
ncbi:MFS transporter [Leuconostoc falkenbergense]|uniref:MFS transporter n=1 Tax=Leuconostoc falkenbergense TaxID=2766470 RepID=UPI0024AE1B54|nr:MFS transporter [Leuconostoc falkenbergense]MDI6666723.1 MFS transporter [Leuconostoc falkenbergense]